MKLRFILIKIILIVAVAFMIVFFAVRNDEKTSSGFASNNNSEISNAVPENLSDGSMSVIESYAVENHSGGTASPFEPAVTGYENLVAKAKEYEENGRYVYAAG